MEAKEVIEMYEEAREKGASKEDILAVLGKAFQDGKITKDQLGALIEPLGMEFTDEFRDMDDEEARKKAVTYEHQETKKGVTPREAVESEESGEDTPPKDSEKEKSKSSSAFSSSSSSSSKNDEDESDDKKDKEDQDRDEAFRLMNLKD